MGLVLHLGRETGGGGGTLPTFSKGRIGRRRVLQ